MILRKIEVAPPSIDLGAMFWSPDERVCMHAWARFEGFFGGPGIVSQIDPRTPFLALGSQEAPKSDFDRFLIDL